MRNSLSARPHLNQSFDTKIKVVLLMQVYLKHLSKNCLLSTVQTKAATYLFLLRLRVVPLLKKSSTS